MRTYTTREAAELTGSSVRALRKRIERGQLRAVQRGRYWRIPHSELERLGLLGLPKETSEGSGRDEEIILASLEQLRAENRRLTEELARLRALLPPVEVATGDLQREHAEHHAGGARADAEGTALAELSERELPRGGFLERWRLLWERRREARAAAGRGYDIPDDLRARLETLPWWSTEAAEERGANARPARR